MSETACTWLCFCVCVDFILLPLLCSSRAVATTTTLTVQDGNSWQHAFAVYLAHHRLQFPLSELPVQLQASQHSYFSIIESPRGERRLVNRTAVEFMRNEVTRLLSRCKDVVVIEGQWQIVRVPAGTLTRLTSAAERSRSQVASPGGSVVMLPLTSFMALATEIVKYHIFLNCANDSGDFVRIRTGLPDIESLQFQLVCTLGFAVTRYHQLLGPGVGRCESFEDFLDNQKELGTGVKSQAGPWVHRAYAAVFNVDIEIVHKYANGSTHPYPIVHSDELPEMKRRAPILLPWCAALHRRGNAHDTCHMYVSDTPCKTNPHFDFFVKVDERIPQPLQLVPQDQRHHFSQVLPAAPLPPPQTLPMLLPLQPPRGCAAAAATATTAAYPVVAAAAYPVAASLQQQRPRQGRARRA